jgi:hypothetical protein
MQEDLRDTALAEMDELAELLDREKKRVLVLALQKRGRVRWRPAHVIVR